VVLMSMMEMVLGAIEGFTNSKADRTLTPLNFSHWLSFCICWQFVTLRFWQVAIRLSAEMLAKTKLPELPGGLAFKINGALVLALRRWGIMVLTKLAGLI
jgi:hypothetical protein